MSALGEGGPAQERPAGLVPEEAGSVAGHLRLGATLLASSIGIAILFFATKGLGFLKDALIAALYGASASSDAFYVALGIVNLTFAITLGGLSASVIPVFVARRVEDGDRSAWGFLYAFLFWLLCGFFVVGALSFAGAEWLVGLFSPEMEPHARRWAVLMVRILAPLPLLTAAGTTLSSALNCYGIFLAPAALPFAGSLVSVTLLLMLAPSLGVVGVAIGVIVGLALQTVTIAWLAVRRSLTYGPRVQLRDPDLRRALRLGLPGVLGEGLLNVNALMIVYLATSLGPGVFSSLQYGNKVQQVFLDVFIAAVGVVMFPRLARSAAQSRLADVNRLYSLNLVVLAVVLVPITALLVELRQPLIEVIYQRRAFDAQAVQRTALALGLLAFSIVPLGIKDSAVKTFYSMHDAWTPLWAIAGSVALNVTLNVLLVRPFGGAGLMLAFSISSACLAAGLLVQLYRRGLFRGDRLLALSGLRIVAATAAMLAVLAVLRVLTAELVVGASSLSKLGALGVFGVVSTAVYVGALLALREPLVAGVPATLGTWWRGARGRGSPRA